MDGRARAKKGGKMSSVIFRERRDRKLWRDMVTQTLNIKELYVNQEQSEVL